jgi:hypothetical protein
MINSNTEDRSMGSQQDISFPVTNEPLARYVLSMEYKIEPDTSGAYVNLDAYRDNKYRNRLLRDLEIDNGEHHPTGHGYQKFLFSGHPGSGKSLELQRLHLELNDDKRFSSMFISLEEQLELNRMQSEDFYILLVTNLAERMQGHDYNDRILREIADDWFTDKEVVEEVTKEAKVEASAEVSVGGNILNLIKLKSGLKNILAGSSKTKETLRRKVRENSKELIDRFNLAISEARNVKGPGLGRDFLFIFDGSEKAPYELYDKIFVKDSHLIRSLQCHAIFSIPINSYFDIERSPKLNFFNCFPLPMIKINDRSKHVFGDIIRKRIDAPRFFEDDALDFAVEMSGGCPRQLLRIARLCLLDREEGPVTKALVDDVCEELGEGMRDLLKSAHLEALKSGDLKKADPAITEMLYQLIILKYNGHREINPLLKRFNLVGNE